MTTEAQKRARRKWRQKHLHPRVKLAPEERRRRQRERYQRLRAELIAYQKRWMAENPERVTLLKREAHVRRSGRIKSTRVARISYRRILERDGPFCGICDGIVNINNLREIHFDHIAPLSKGGAHVESNIQVSHVACNLKKHASLPP